MKFRDIIIATGILAASCTPILIAHAEAQERNEVVDDLLAKLLAQEEERKKAAIEQVFRGADTEKQIRVTCWDRYKNDGGFEECVQGLRGLLK